MTDHRYSDAEIMAIDRAIRERRDMRHFLPDPLARRRRWHTHGVLTAE